MAAGRDALLRVRKYTMLPLSAHERVPPHRYRKALL